MCEYPNKKGNVPNIQAALIKNNTYTQVKVHQDKKKKKQAAP